MKGYNKYFISYTFLNQNSTGFGNIETYYDKEIKGMDDINTISRKIEEDLKLPNKTLVILNFIKLD
ncbi:hypothetical protein J2S74_002886 [Evansella vedderi]|uniref:Uncharacterized protein n=1 Tax=Evansella vedderi TaxID=38282 RepID=A0ABT9ZXA8_9BACI|nr:hypothetical protein [Evansella vedderi]MDQ0255504.1 hypothetical protein [Evansella vedderi]